MKYQHKKVAGIWLDHHHAYIIRTPDYLAEGEYDVREKIKAEHHGERSGSEHTFHQKEARELNKFFREICKHIQQVDALYIFGPGKAQEQFKNYLSEDKHFQSKEIIIGTAQHQTPNQLIAQVRAHFYHN
jgi:stalled ribosome rescue protein Dom34